MDKMSAQEHPPILDRRMVSRMSGIRLILENQGADAPIQYGLLNSEESKLFDFLIIKQSKSPPHDKLSSSTGRFPAKGVH